jgi:large subunit ribosomal protein L6
MSTKEKAEVSIPENVNIIKRDHIVVVTGRKGTISKDIHKLPAAITVTDRTVTIEPEGKRKSDLAITNTAKKIIANMFKGVEKGYVYKLKIVFAHFPISVRVKGREIHVENFFW